MANDWTNSSEEKEKIWEMVAKVKKIAGNGVLSCPQALQLAADESVPPLLVGRAADLGGIKIIGCQLGCFGAPKVTKRREESH